MDWNASKMRSACHLVRLARRTKIARALPLVLSLMACATEAPQQNKPQPTPMERTEVRASAAEEVVALCGVASWRERASAVVFVPALNLLLWGGGGIVAKLVETRERVWMQTFHLTENVRGSKRGRDRLLGILRESLTLQGFRVHDGVALYADTLHAGTVDVRTGEVIAMIGGYGFKVAWDREVIQRAGVAYSADEAGVTIADASGSELVAGARLLACDTHDLLVLVESDGSAQALLEDGTRAPMNALPTPVGVHRLYSSGGELKAAVADGAKVHADGVCWEAEEDVGELFVTPFGVAGMEFDPEAEERDDPMDMRRFQAVAFFPFPEERDVAQCRWVTEVPRLVDTRPIRGTK